MPYDSVISRQDAAGLIPEEVAREIFQHLPEASVVMQLGRRLPNMSRGQQRLPVLSTLLTAYFVTGDMGLKQTSEMAWSNKYIEAEELAVIVPIPEAVLDDADYDIWGEIQPRITEAFAAAFDAAVLFGTNAPSSWPAGIVPGAIAAGHSVEAGTGADLYEDIMGPNGYLALVEADGYQITGHVAALAMRARLRGLRDTQGQPLFVTGMQGAPVYSLDGAPIYFPRNGSFDSTQALMVSGDWSQLVWAVRQDITYKVLSESVIQNASGAIVYNLAQQDMVALRAVMRIGWQLPNPVNRIQPTEGGVIGGSNVVGRYPFGVLLPESEGSGS